jgi:flagellin
MRQFLIKNNATNNTLGIQIGDGQSVSLNLNSSGADLYLDNMSDVASLIQSKINASGNFTGANAVTVSAVKDANSNWGLSFSNATNQKIALTGLFMTAAAGGAVSVNSGTTILPTGTITKTLIATPQFGSFAAKTIDLTGVNAADGTTNIANSMKAFKLNVNGGGDVSIDMSTALTNMGLTETVTNAAISQSQFVRAMQTAIDSTGLFAGNNKVTVGTTDNGQISLTVAGGAGSIVMKEASATTSTATQYDGLVKVLTGTNNGVIGNALEAVTSGGKLVLGATYNANVASSNAQPAGQLSLTTGTANDAQPLKLNLRDSLGNVTTVTTTNVVVNNTSTLANLLNIALAAATGAADSGGVASLYTVTQDIAGGVSGASKVTIKRLDGVDFTVQVDAGSTTTAQLTADSLSSSALVKGGAAASSSQLINTFTTGPTRIGAGDGGVIEVVTSAITAAAAGDSLTFDGFSYKVTAANVGAVNPVNSTADAFVSGYNAQPDARFIAARTLTTGQITFTAKTTGDKDNANAVLGVTGAAGTAVTNTRVEGTTLPTYNVENVLSLKVGNHSYDVKVATNDYEYSTLSQLKDKVQSAIDGTVGLSGANRVVVGISTDSSGKSGLTFTQATGQELSVSGNFITNELKVAQTAPTKIVSVFSGGVDLSANNTLSVNLVDANTGASTTKNITLNSTSKNVSLADYAALVQSSINSAFSADGFSVTASSSNGNFSLAMNNQPTKTMTVSGASVSAAFGVGSLQASGVPVNSMASMSDVVREIQTDLGDVATVAYDAAKGQMTFAATNGTAGTGNTISLSGAGLAAIQFGGTLTATGAAGNATASKLSDINVLTTAAATSALGSIDNSIEYVSKQRALLGAIENRLAHTVNNLTNIVTNTSASRSAIEDTDYSKETSALAKSQIITQAATAMLAQANQSAQSVLSLLK